MSTKIWTAYRVDLEHLELFSIKFREASAKWLGEAMQKFFNAYKPNIPLHQKNEDFEKFVTGKLATQAAINQAIKDQDKRRPRIQPVLDEINYLYSSTFKYLIDDGKCYIIPWGGLFRQKEFNQWVREGHTPTLVDYHYQDQTDPYYSEAPYNVDPKKDESGEDYLYDEEGDYVYSPEDQLIVDEYANRAEVWDRIWFNKEPKPCWYHFNAVTFNLNSYHHPTFEMGLAHMGLTSRDILRSKFAEEDSEQNED